MKTFYLNYKDVHFLLGDYTVAEAKNIIRDILEKDGVIDKYTSVNISHTVDSNRIDILIKSPFEEMNGQKKIPYIINQMRTIGISDMMKHALLEDVTNVVRGGIYGKWVTLKKILPEKDIKALEDSLRNRRASYLGCRTNKVPKVYCGMRQVTGNG